MVRLFGTSTAVAALMGYVSGFAAPAIAQSTANAPARQAGQTSAYVDTTTAAGTAAQTSNSPGIGEIVVTAQKRSQRLNDVPLSISVASSQALQSSGITNATGLGAVVPGFTSSTSVFGPPVFSLRGVNFNSFQASAPPAVSSYVDEAVLPYPIMGQALFLDVDHVEVLKGPQGTLFGQNATGGSINVIAAKPTSKPAAGFHVDVNNFGETFVEGYISGPITDTLKARLAVQTDQFGAWQHGYYLNDQKNGDQDKVAGRLLVDWTPTERLTVNVNLNAARDRSEQQQPQISIINPVIPAAASAAFLSYANHLPTNDRQADFDTGYDTRARNHTYQAVLRADYKLTDELTFTSLTDYVDTRYSAPHDQDGTAVDQQEATASANIHSINQEARLTGAYPDAGLNFVVGASYGHDNIIEGASNNYAGYTGFPAGAAAYWRYHLTQRARAVFASADYKILPNLTITAGARYSGTRQSDRGCTYDAGDGLFAATAGGLASIFNPAAGSAYVPGGCSTINDAGPNPTYLPVETNLSQKEHNIAWRGALNYKPTSNILLYGSVSRGFKAGTFPVIVNLFESAIQPVKQEKLTSYEVGTKLTLFDHKLQLNVSAFHYDYRNKQFFSFQPVFGGILVTASLVNIPKSTDDGIDMDFTAEPIKGLRVAGGVTYIKTKTKKYVGFDYAGQPEDFSGKEFSYAPPWSANVDGEYQIQTYGPLKPFIGGTVTYRDRTYADLGEVQSFYMKAYTLVDARIGIQSEKGWRVSLYGRNLTNKYYWQSVASFGDGAVRFAGMPRTFGATFSEKF